MKLEQQVTNLELSKKLKELGMGQESLFWYAKTGYSGKHSFLGTKRDMDRFKEHEYDDMPGANDTYDFISTFTVAELGEMLPFGTKSIHIDAWDETYQGGKTWMCNAPERKKRHIEYADTEANARAKMLIYLMENDLIDISK